MELTNIYIFLFLCSLSRSWNPTKKIIQKQNKNIVNFFERYLRQIQLNYNLISCIRNSLDIIKVTFQSTFLLHIFTENAQTALNIQNETRHKYYNFFNRKKFTSLFRSNAEKWSDSHLMNGFFCFFLSFF